MNKVVYNDSYGGFTLSDEAKEILEAKGYNDFYEIERHNKDLVEVVEQLGKRASGHYSKLEIKEIESNIYYIADYDGYETVITPKYMEELWVKINNNEQESQEH